MHSLSNDLIGKIFGYLPYHMVLINKRVCQRWNSIITNWRFLAAHFPDYKCKLHLMRSEEAFEKDIRAYKREGNQPYDIRKLSIKRCRYLDDEIHEHNLRIQSLSLNHQSMILSEDMDHLISKLSLSAAISAKSLSMCILIDLLDNCVKHRVQIRKLKLHKPGLYDSTNVNLVRNNFASMLKNNDFPTPLHLDLRGSRWVNQETLASLINPKIRLSYFRCSLLDEECVPLLMGVQWTTPCEIKPSGTMNNNFLSCLIERNISVRYLCLTEDVTEDMVCTLFKAHLVSPSKLEIHMHSLTARVVSIVREKKLIFDCVTIGDHSLDIDMGKRAIIKDLLETGSIRGLKFRGQDKNPSSFYHASTPQPGIRLRKFKSLNIEDSWGFETFASSALFSGSAFSLSVGGQLNGDRTLQVLTKPNLKFRKFEFIPDWDIKFTIMPLVMSGALDNCKELLLSSTCQDVVEACAALAQRNFVLRKLQLSVGKKGSEFTELLGNRRAFPQLHNVWFHDFAVYSSEFRLAVQKNRPGLKISYVTHLTQTIKGK